MKSVGVSWSHLKSPDFTDSKVTWSQLKLVGIRWSQLESVGVRWSQSKSAGVSRNQSESADFTDFKFSWSQLESPGVTWSHIWLHQTPSAFTPLIPLNDTVLFGILHQCPAAIRKTLSGLDNISADGSIASDELAVMCDELAGFGKLKGEISDYTSLSQTLQVRHQMKSHNWRNICINLATISNLATRCTFQQIVVCLTTVPLSLSAIARMLAGAQHVTTSIMNSESLLSLSTRSYCLTAAFLPNHYLC